MNFELDPEAELAMLEWEARCILDRLEYANQRYIEFLSKYAVKEEV